MRIEVDILDYTIDGILSLEYDDRQWKPVAFLSKSLNKTKGNSEIYNEEMLVVIR